MDNEKKEEKKQVEVKVKDQKKKNKFSRVLLPVITVSFIIFFLIGLTMPINQMKTALNNGDYDEVESLYSKNQDGSLTEEYKLLVKEKAVEIFNSYNNEDIDYLVAKENLEKIQKTKIEKNEIEKLVENLDNLKTSKESYVEGVKYLDNKEYVRAVKSLDKVVEYDINYKDAQDLILENIKSRQDELIATAKDLEEEDDYSKSIDYLEKNQEWDKTGIIKAKIQYYKQHQLENVEKKAIEYIKNREFDKAIEILKDNLHYTDIEKEEYLKIIGTKI